MERVQTHRVLIEGQREGIGGGGPRAGSRGRPGEAGRGAGVERAVPGRRTDGALRHEFGLILPPARQSTQIRHKTDLIDAGIAIFPYHPSK
ncbi:hypothetical protein N007_01755 [Alicyclobacillus acidoterrestris ATCC 49025]|nr:hypothetical protein N007_01755 [Alicyclobacillus acidoterrestris ATCC 49025]